MHTDEWKSEIGEDYDAISKQGESAGSLPTAASVFTFCGQNVQTHWKSPICDIRLHLLKAVEKFQLQPIRRNHGLAHIGIFEEKDLVLGTSLC